jgi:hypothetical protein
MSALALLAVIGIGVAFAAGVFSNGSTLPPATTTVPSNAPLDARAAAVQFSSLLDRNSGARAEVVDAVNRVTNCATDGQSGASAMDAPIATRQAIVDDLKRLDVAALPEGGELRSSLTIAMQDSITADRHFQDWMRAVAATGCQGQAPQNADYAAANASSEAATGSKNAFVAAWNPVAGRYGLRQVQETGL